MPSFADIMTRTGTAAELPDQIATELVTGTIRESTVLALGNKVPTSVRDSRIPVLTEIPEAYWTDNTDTNETGLEQTTAAIFGNQTLIAEELACIAPIPKNILDDSEFDVWAYVKPLLVQAMGKAVDDAVMFGVNAPVTFPPSLVQAATDAGNVVSGDVFAAADVYDLPASVLECAAMIGMTGYAPTGAVVAPAWEFRAAAQRTPSLVANPVGADGPFPMLLGGLGLHTNPLKWRFAQADAIVAQWNLVLVGMRKDITLETFNTGVISDSTGKVVLNLLQQNAIAVRLTMRVGYYLANPPTDAIDETTGLPLDSQHRCPVAIVTNSGTPAGLAGVLKPAAKPAAQRAAKSARVSGK